MDIAKIRHYLNDEYPIEDTTNEIFLNEFGKIFESLRNSGDTKQHGSTF